jgi:hypothetical protein
MEELMTRRTLVRLSPAPGFLVGVTYSALLFLSSPGAVQGQSARFDEFAETSPKAGEMAPDFTLLTLDNEPFNLMEVAADRPVVIEFGSFT